MSDLHLDFYINNTNPSGTKMYRAIQRFVDNNTKQEVGDIIIMAGDISHYNTQTQTLIEILKDRYKEVLFTAGNHEMYLISGNMKDKYQCVSERRIDELSIVAETTGAHFLNGDVFEAGGIKVGGSCGWYNLPTKQDILDWNKYTRDSTLIFNGYPIHAAYGGEVRVPWDTQAFYEQELQKLKNIAEVGCDILVNHVAQLIPPLFTVPNAYKNAPSNKFYYTDNYNLIKQSGCSLYVFGHTHDSYEFTRDGVEAICNPIGYPGENPRSCIKQICMY